MHRTAFTALAAAAVATGAIGIPAADAATLEDLISQNLQFIFEDDSVEDLNVDGGTQGVLDEGDTLRGVFSFPFFNSSVTGERLTLDGSANSAVHGVFEAQVAEKTPAGAGTFNYSFEPYAPFAAEVGGVDGAMIGLWESNTPLNVFNCGNQKSICETAAKAGDLRMVLGFEGDTGTWTTSPAPENIEAARGVPQTTNIATYDFAMSVLSSDLEVPPFINVPGFDSEAIGSGRILGSAGSSSPYPTFNDADAELAVVPVPAALPLFLAGLGALGMIGWRRNAD